MTNESAEEFSMVSASHVSKSVRGKVLLEDISFSLGRGTTALVGPNGAGKTTLLRILTGLWKATTGTVQILGHDLRSNGIGARRETGFQPEFPDLHPDLRPAELLELVAAARRLPAGQVEETVSYFGAGPLMDARCGSLSQGQKRLVTLVAALVHRPRLLLMDEPTNALDPHRVARLKDYLAGPHAPEALLISTHQLDFVSTIAQRYILLSQGKVVGEGTLEELRSRTGNRNASLEEIVLTMTAPRG